MKKEFFENKIEGFSRLNKKKKIEWIESNYFRNQSTSILEKYLILEIFFFILKNNLIC